MSSAKGSPKARIVEVDSNHDGQRLDNYLATRLKGVPKSRVYRMIRKGEVRVNGGRCKPLRKLQLGDKVRIPPLRTASRQARDIPSRVLQQIRNAVLYQDTDLLVIDKPAGMAVHSGSGLAWGVIDAVKQAFPDKYFELIHRLDRETSGCLLLACNLDALRHYTAQFSQGKVDKQYLCLMEGRLPEPVVEVDAPLRKVEAGGQRIVEVRDDGKQAVSIFHALEVLDSATYAQVQLITGRTHQIRAHARHLGMPLAGDELYSSRESLKRWSGLGLKRLFLHAATVSLQRPEGQSLEVSSPLPPVLSEVLGKLGI